VLNPLVIIHGWSDSSVSFKNLAQLLLAQTGRNAQLVNLADYISMDDEITFDDLTTTLERAWRRCGLPITPGAVDVIVHSTGGLIIRDWLTRFYMPTTAPIKHLLMLAPANFGSQLAHKGRAFFGRILKGFNSEKLFEVGEKLLKGLELASPYSRQLALRDRFSNQNFYGPGKILCTVLIGNTGFTGISAAANEDGSDGTVRIACANLNCAYLKADFYTDPLRPSYTLQNSNGTTAFAVLDQENHHTIINTDGGFKNANSLCYMLQALQVSDKDFPAWCKALAQATDHGFQNTVSFVHDQFDQHISDYFLEFYNDKESWLADLFHRAVITTTHAYSDDTSYRSLYMDCTVLYQQFAKSWPELQMSLTALPEFKKNQNVGYLTFTDKDIGGISINKEQLPTIFQANRTLFIDILLRREQADHVFDIQPLKNV
jgi:hypothetical protein